MLTQLVQTVEGGICRLGRKLCNEDPLAELREEANHLSEELQRRRAALERNRVLSGAVARRLARAEVNAALLVSRVETYVHVGDAANAWQHALELDHVRHAIRRDRAQLRQHEEISRRHQTHLRQIEGQLADVLHQLYPR
jgi:hypothetical protein